MTIEKYISIISKKVRENEPYDEYKNIIFEYIGFLEKALTENPKDIRAICQLSIAYLEAREPVEKSIKLVEDALNNCKDTLSSQEMGILFNNLAFFYGEEMENVEKSKQLLEMIINLNIELPNPYNALGIIYMDEGNVIEALKLFGIAVMYSKDIKYKNNYAASLYQIGEIEQATNIFYKISKAWRHNKTAAQAYYSYGMCVTISGKFELGTEVANNLQSLVTSNLFKDEIWDDEFEDLYELIWKKGNGARLDFKPELIRSCYLIDCIRHNSCIK